MRRFGGVPVSGSCGLLLLVALRSRVRGFELGIADYHRALSLLFNRELSYGTVWRNLRKLESTGILRSDLVRSIVRNDLVDSRGVIKVRRFTRVYKRVYELNCESKLARRFIGWMAWIARKVFKTRLETIVSNRKLINTLSMFLESERS